MTTTRIGVGRVRLRADASDAAHARLRLGSVLAGAELRPPGLPPAAVLCVRRVVDPLPGTLRLDTAEARPPPEWERAFAAALEHARRGAARPALEAVPAGAEAVLFADRAELLACLARDARDGTAWLRWWWHDLRVASPGGADPAFAAWLETPEHVPAALELLAARSEAVPFVATLDAASAQALVLRVAEVHALPGVLRAAAAAAPAAPPRSGARAPGTAGLLEPPWRELVPESREQPLHTAAELLLGVALVLRRAPTVARSSAFAAATQAWLAGAPQRSADDRTRAAATAPPVQREIVPHPAPSRSRTGVALHTILDGGPPPAPAEITASTPPEATAPAPSPARTGGQQADSQTRDTPAPAAVPAAPASAEDTSPLLSSSTPAPRAEAAPTPAASPPGSPRTAPTRKPARRRPGSTPHEAVVRTPRRTVEPPAELPDLVVGTDLGGVFYLLNLALYLELYGDFAHPLEPGLGLSPWDLLALLAPRLLTEPSPEDPLWPLLARLAGRSPRERPGRGFRPPRAWRTPPAWLAPFDHDETWRWSAARGTLRLVHPAGFPVAAVARTHEPPRAQLARELRRLRPLTPALQRTALQPESTQPLARWTNRLAAYADARLRRALGLGAGDSLDALLLRRRARIFVTSTHVDVTLGLADLPLEVRFAGLDRTPGWVPAAGRFLAFHLE